LDSGSWVLTPAVVGSLTAGSVSIPDRPGSITGEFSPRVEASNLPAET
jgi:hypothetical protein